MLGLFGVIEFIEELVEVIVLVLGGGEEVVSLVSGLSDFFEHVLDGGKVSVELVLADVLFSETRQQLGHDGARYLRHFHILGYYLVDL